MPSRQIWLHKEVRDTDARTWSPRVLWVFAAISFALVQSGLGLFVLWMALVNSKPEARTIPERILMVIIYTIWLLSFLIIVGAWRRWSVRGLGMLACLILVCWGIFYLVP
jgi:hypothetical protein